MGDKESQDTNADKRHDTYTFILQNLAKNMTDILGVLPSLGCHSPLNFK